MQFIKRIKSISIVILLLLFFIELSPFIHVIPYLDGNIDFVKVIDFYQGGLGNFLSKWGSTHPPLKMISLSLLFTLFGIQTTIYNLFGIIIGAVGIYFAYLSGKEFSNEKGGLLTGFLLATSGLFISTSLFSLIDFLVTVFLLGAIFFYLKNKKIGYSILASLAVLSKETALLFPFAVLFIELIYHVFHKRNSTKKISQFLDFFYYIIPFIVYQVWVFILQTFGKSVWNDWNFSSTADKGAIYTILHNVITLELFNKYAYEQWMHVFFLNFSWVLWVVLFLLAFLLLKENKSKLMLLLKHGELKTKAFLIIVLFELCYFFCVLSFQTYTIPRYTLPFIGFLYVMIGFFGALYIRKKRIFTSLVLIVLVLFQYISLFFSVDPVSTSLWGRTTIFSQTFYNLPQTLDGNDGITYNLQFLLIANKRTEILKTNKENVIFSSDCPWIFPDPNNDLKTLNILHLSQKNLPMCLAR